MPKWFTLLHIIEERRSVLVCRYAKNLDYNELFKRREVISIEIQSWAEKLPLAKRTQPIDWDDYNADDYDKYDV
jgi:hypothetical protein